MKYFAYGSNMHSARLRKRVPSATVIGAAMLSQHALRWHKLSIDGSGKCDAFYTGEEPDAVLGVLFEIPESEKHALDTAEGGGKGYDESQVTVMRGTLQVTAFAYLAQSNAIQRYLVPFDWYKAYVVAGAREHGLPVAYVAGLETQPSKMDSNESRRNRAFEVLKMTDL